MKSYNYEQAIVDLLGEPKNKNGNEWNYFNPLGDDGENPDFWVNIKSGTYNCFSSEHQGHFTELYAEMNEVDTKEAFKELVSKFPTNGCSAYQLQSKSKKDYDFIYSKKLSVNANDKKMIIESLMKRSIQEDYIKSLIKAGQIKYNNDAKYTTGLVVPVYNSKNNKIVAIQKISPDFKEKKFNGSVKSEGAGYWITPGGRQKQKNHNTLYIVESFVNSVTLGMYGYNSMCVFSAKNTDFPPQFFKNYEKIIVCFDNDSEGGKGAEKIAKSIGTEKCLIFSWPEGTPDKFDINDILKKNASGFEVEFEKLLKNVKPVKKQADYWIENNSYFYLKTIQKVSFPIKVSNFIIDIEKDTELSDGYEQKRILIGKIKGSDKCCRFTLEASSFFSNNKLQEAIGSQAGTIAQFMPENVKHIRKASLQLSNPIHESVLMQFGWNDDETFLSPSTIINNDGINSNSEKTVDLSSAETARHLDLQIISDEKFNQISKHIIEDLLNLQSHKITYPLIGHIFISPLMRFLSDTTRYLLWLKGITGCGKSFTARFFQCFYGDFSADSSIVSWTSTMNFIQMVGFYFKDSSFLVDDFKKGNISRRGEFIQKIQSYADGTGRGRLNADSSTKQVRPIRGLMISTGEDIPEYEASILARTLIVDCRNENKNIGAGSKCLTHRKYYSGVMGRFIHWCIQEDIKSEMDGLIQDATKLFYEDIRGEQNDIRIARNLSLNYSGFILFCDFITDFGIINKKKKQQMIGEAEKILTSICNRQIQTVKSEQASNVFISTLADLIANRRVTIINDSKDTYDTKMKANNIVGFIKSDDDGYVYINPSVAYQEVQKAIAQGGSSLNFSQNAIGKQLLDDGYLKFVTGDRTTKVVNFEGHSQRVWVFERIDLGFLDE